MGAELEGSAPTVGGLVGEVLAGWAARVSLVQRSAGQDRRGGLNEGAAATTPGGLAVDAHPVGGGVRGTGEGLELLGDVLGRVGRVQVRLAVVVEVGDELVAL